MFNFISYFKQIFEVTIFCTDVIDYSSFCDKNGVPFTPFTMNEKNSTAVCEHQPSYWSFKLGKESRADIYIYIYIYIYILY